MNYKIGDLVELESEVNDKLIYGLEDIVGVNITKQMIPTIANLKETSLEKFYIVKPKSFIYNPRTHGKKIGLGYNKSSRNYIATWNNNVFKIKSSMKNIINSDYLYMYFNRDIWDKEACFHSWGSSTVVLSWESFCEMPINLPDIKEQEKIVNQYNIINERIEILSNINIQLEKIAFDYYTYTISENTCRKIKLNQIGEIVTGKTPSKAIEEYYDSNDIPFIKTPDMHENIYVTSYESYISKKGADSQKNKYLQANTVIMSCIGSAGEIALTSELSQTNQQINAVISKYPYYLYFALKKEKNNILVLGDGSTTMVNINKTDFGNYEIDIVNDNCLEEINSKLELIFNEIRRNTLEKRKLIQINKCLIIDL